MPHPFDDAPAEAIRAARAEIDRLMTRRHFVIGASAAAAAAALSPDLASAQAAPNPIRGTRSGWIETPSLVEAVKSGALPPVGDRVPREPLIVDLPAKDRVEGVHGGTLRTLIRKDKDIRYAVVWGYARLMGFDHRITLQPDILRAIEVDRGRAFTFHLREGHRWSDGSLFTSEDFRYWWEDMANNEELAPAGPPALMIVDGAPATFELIDEKTVRFVWPKANPLLLSELAAARPPFIYRPAAHMKRYHARYRDTKSLQYMIADKNVRNWAQLHNSLDDMYKFDDAALPTLQPWYNATDGKAQRYRMARNPFYHRVDAAGRQLPYADGIEMTVASSGLYPIKAQNGEVDIQARGLAFADVPSLKRGEDLGAYDTRLWRTGAASHIALYPNLTAKDPGWRALMRDKRFRQALSLGIDRALINETLYSGLAKPVGNGVLPESPMFDAERRERYAAFDPAGANALLDQIGLIERRGDGVRRMPDGRPLELIVESAGERIEEIDALQLVTETWREIGIKLLTRSTNRDLLRNRAYAGQSVMNVWFGWDAGAPSPSTPPEEVTPVRQDVLCWPAWGQFHQTDGSSGEAPDTPEGVRLMEIYRAWMAASNDAERDALWREALTIHAEEVYLIGLIAEAPQPVVLSKRLKNAPAEALYSWNPGAQFGVHRPDEWWFDDQPKSASAPAKKA
ncbi:MAG: ABC transporter substrate-binding protein [Pseudomonadota bacterium]